jgi:hypothetical protein
MMRTLANQRCFNHDAREAAARCPECVRYYCRECVTEHEGKVLCASCLRQRLNPRSASSGVLRTLTQALQWLLGLVLVWFFFFFIGESLAQLPDAFHESVLWSAPWPDSE